MILLISGCELAETEKIIDIDTSCVIEAEKEVKGDSMEPLIKQGEILILMEGYYSCNEIERGDIVAYDYGGNKNPIIKKIMVLGGDTLEFNDNVLLVNKEPLKNSEDKIYEFSEQEKRMIGLYIKDNKLVNSAFLIFGENINNGLDSRKFGAVGKNDFLGKFKK